VTTPVIDVEPVENNLRVNVYPNPVAANSIVELNMPETGKTELTLFDALGKSTVIVYSGSLTKGKHRIQLSDKTGHLPAGMYLLRVQAKNEIRSVKIMIQ